MIGRFLDNVVTSTLVCESDPDQPGLWREYEGGIDDWLSQWQRSQALKSASAQPPSAAAKPAGTAPDALRADAPPGKPRKLSYKEQRELDALPEHIAALETEQSSLRSALADPQIYVDDPAKAAALHQRDAEIEEALMQALERWDTLGG